MLEWFNSSFCSWIISLSSLIVDSEIPTWSLSFLFEDSTGVLLLRGLAKGSGYSVNSYLHLSDNKQKSRQKCFTHFGWWKGYINYRELSLSKKRYQYKRASGKEGKGLEKSRSSHRRCFAMFTRKHLCWSLFSIILQAFRPATLLERGSSTVFSRNIAIFLRKPILKSICERLLVEVLTPALLLYRQIMP